MSHLSRYATSKNARRAYCDPLGSESLTARMAQVIALTALAALGLSGASLHEPFHADGGQRARDRNRA